MNVDHAGHAEAAVLLRVLSARMSQRHRPPGKTLGNTWLVQDERHKAAESRDPGALRSPVVPRAEAGLESGTSPDPGPSSATRYAARESAVAVASRAGSRPRRLPDGDSLVRHDGRGCHRSAGGGETLQPAAMAARARSPSQVASSIESTSMLNAVARWTAS